MAAEILGSLDHSDAHFATLVPRTPHGHNHLVDVGLQYSPWSMGSGSPNIGRAFVLVFPVVTGNYRETAGFFALERSHRGIFW
jgi:hypothetical protein